MRIKLWTRLWVFVCMLQFCKIVRFSYVELHYFAKRCVSNSLRSKPWVWQLQQGLARQDSRHRRTGSALGSVCHPIQIPMTCGQLSNPTIQISTGAGGSRRASQGRLRLRIQHGRRPQQVVEGRLVDQEWDLRRMVPTERRGKWDEVV